MNFSGCFNFEDLLKACGFTNSNNTANNSGCSDIPFGFQSLSPGLFSAIGAILGEIIAGNIPFNVQNALGNWLELIGQIILVYNAQQQYFEGGPGPYFSPQRYNINNQACNSNSSSGTASSRINSGNNNSNSSSSAKNNAASQQNQNMNPQLQDKFNKIDELESRINDLINEIEVIKNTLNTLSKDP